MAKKGGMFRQSRKVARGQGAAGGGINPAMMRQAQDLQEKLAAVQDEIKEATVEASAGGGVVNVVLGGDQRLREVTIDPDVVDPEDTEMLRDLLIAAVNEAKEKLDQLQEERMAGLTDGLPLPGLS